MTDDLNRDVTIQLLKDKLLEQAEPLGLADTKPPKYYVVAVGESLERPLCTMFELGDEPSMAAYLKSLVNKPVFVFVFFGTRCAVSVGSMPALYAPGGVIIPLFDIAQPVFNDDGFASVLPEAPVIPDEEIPTEDDRDHEDAEDEAVEDPSETAESGPELFADDPELPEENS